MVKKLEVSDRNHKEFGKLLSEFDLLLQILYSKCNKLHDQDKVKRRMKYLGNLRSKLDDFLPLRMYNEQVYYGVRSDVLGELFTRSLNDE